MENAAGKISRPLLLFVIFGMLLAGSIYYFYEEKLNSNKIILHGNVDIRQVELGFRISGRLETMHFEEGDLVKKGDILATVDKAPYRHDVDNLKAQVLAAAANLSKLNTGNRPQEIQEAIALVNQQQATYENTEKIFNRKKDLLQKNYASKQEYDDAFAAQKEARAKLKTAQEALKLIKEGFRVEDIEAANAQLDAIKAQLAIAEIKLHDTDLVAPNDGVILTRIQEPGAILSIGSPVYSLSLINPVWVRAYVSETNLGRIKPGMKALVYTDSEPDKPYQGHIGFISPVAEFTPKNIETKELRTDLVYRLRIIVNDKDGFLKQGMPVTAIIQSQKANTDLSSPKEPTLKQIPKHD
ncbi:MAG: secretion protein HlyD [Candidatus Berkiella sp.]